MYHTIVTLKKGEGRTIKSGGAWVFDNEIDTITGRFKNGDLVTVHDFDGYPMGSGFINQNSKIRIRMMTRKADQEIDHAFLTMRVKNAWDYRKTTVDTSSCRIIFGEADFLPGLVIDKYEDILVVECLARNGSFQRRDRNDFKRTAGQRRHHDPRRLRAKRCQ